jgi:hypothetical protein
VSLHLPSHSEASMLRSFASVSTIRGIMFVKQDHSRRGIVMGHLGIGLDGLDARIGDVKNVRSASNWQTQDYGRFDGDEAGVSPLFI